MVEVHGAGASVATKPAAGTAHSGPVIETRKLSKYFGHVRAIEDVDFELAWGEVHAVVGDNGAGKSTFIKMLSGAVQPTSGEILVEGSAHSFRGPEGALEKGIATVYQDLALVACRSIEDNLFLGREPVAFGGWLKRGAMRAEATALLAELRQMNVHDTTMKVDSLSGGQRQAVAIARGIRLASRVLILDEPTAALGVRETQQILELVERLRSPERALVLISHNLQEVFRVADRITVFRSGRKVGTVRKLDTTPDEIVRMITGADAL